MTETDQPRDEARRLTIGEMALLADQLEEALAEFEAWGVGVSDLGRLPASLGALRGYADAGRFPHERTALAEVALIVRDTQEFVEIANALPEEALRPLVDSLQHAVRGNVGTAASTAAQFQSELWVGAMLAQSGHRTSVITEGEGKRPDFVLENGSYLYPVEVKRPAGELNAQDIVDRAGRQLRGSQYHGGGLTVDLTDCVPADVAVSYGTGEPEGNPADERMIGLTGELNAQIFDEASGRIRDRRIHIFTLVTFARTVYWDEDDLSEVYLFRKVSSVVYYRGQPNNLRGRRARALTEAIHSGIRASGHRDLGQVQIQL